MIADCKFVRAIGQSSIPQSSSRRVILRGLTIRVVPVRQLCSRRSRSIACSWSLTALSLVLEILFLRLKPPSVKLRQELSQRWSALIRVGHAPRPAALSAASASRESSSRSPRAGRGWAVFPPPAKRTGRPAFAATPSVRSRLPSPRPAPVTDTSVESASRTSSNCFLMRRRRGRPALHRPALHAGSAPRGSRPWRRLVEPRLHNRFPQAESLGRCAHVTINSRLSSLPTGRPAPGPGR